METKEKYLDYEIMTLGMDILIKELKKEINKSETDMDMEYIDNLVTYGCWADRFEKVNDSDSTIIKVAKLLDEHITVLDLINSNQSFEFIEYAIDNYAHEIANRNSGIDYFILAIDKNRIDVLKKIMNKPYFYNSLFPPGTDEYHLRRALINRDSSIIESVLDYFKTNMNANTFLNILMEYAHNNKYTYTIIKESIFSKENHIEFRNENVDIFYTMIVRGISIGHLSEKDAIELLSDVDYDMNTFVPSHSNYHSSLSTWRKGGIKEAIVLSNIFTIVSNWWYSSSYWKPHETILFASIKSGYNELTKMLLEKPEFDPNVKKDFATPLTYAIASNNLYAVKELLKHSKIKPNLKITTLSYSFTPLNLAIYGKKRFGFQREIIDELLNHPKTNPFVQSNYKDDKYSYRSNGNRINESYNFDSLLFAINENDFKTIQKIITNKNTKDSDIEWLFKYSENNFQNNFKNKLSSAQDPEFLEFMEFIISEEFLTKFKDVTYYGMLQLAKSEANDEYVNNVKKIYLEVIKHHKESRGILSTIVYNSFLLNMNSIVKHIINEFPSFDVNSKISSRDTALTFVTEHGRKDLFNYLLSLSNIDVNVYNNPFADTPLIIAINNENDYMVKSLLSNSNIDPNLQNKDGMTPLMKAVRNGYTPAVQKLLKHPDINVNLKNNSGKTALYLAVENMNFDIIKELLNNKTIDVNANSVDNLVNSVLFKAIDNKNNDDFDKIFELLINHKDINIESRSATNEQIAWNYVNTDDAIREKYPQLNPDSIKIKRDMKILKELCLEISNPSEREKILSFLETLQY